MTSEDEMECRLLDDDTPATDETAKEETMPKMLSGLGKTLETISTAMLHTEKSMKRLHSDKTSDSEGRPNKTRRLAPQNEVEIDSNDSDAKGLLQSTKEPNANSANAGNTSEAQVRLQHDSLLDKISQDLEQLEEVGGNINQQLADINKCWSSKVTEAKQKEKMDNYSRPGNCEKIAVPRVNEEIWGKLDNKTKHNDLRATSTQKLLAKVDIILTITTDRLLQMRNADLPEVD
ncbi:Hypothetical predicted protein [Paramuricea clavata]|uniref:Uncharacterized protein n=1 Tax=Paramuricea clavata TaxID=317549 RepID=A0A6S7G4D0_PARCT|nr:Hypothetical predicted protein [Paramuricea clavata]